MGHPWPLFHFISIFSYINKVVQQLNVTNDPSSIRWWDSNLQILWHEFAEPLDRGSHPTSCNFFKIWPIPKLIVWIFGHFNTVLIQIIGCSIPNGCFIIAQTPLMQWLEVIIARLHYHGEYRWSDWPRYVGNWLLPHPTQTSRTK